ncbi:MAG TPA: DUF4097 family beta strand repeat-containing protein [Streptosporangiaceae bacterium]
MIRFPSATAARAAAAAGAVLIVAAAGISGCASLHAAGLGQSSVTQTYTPAVPVTSLIVNDPDGSVSVSSGSGSAVSVTATIYYDDDKPSITHTVSGQALTLGYSSCTDCGVAFTITVPRTASVAINGHSGDVTVASLAGDVSVVHDIGRVTMTGLTGNVSVQNHIGSISGTGLSAAQASLHNGAGNIDVAFTSAPRRLSAVSRTGRVSVRVPSGNAYQVNASSNVGSVKVSVPQSPATTHVITATVTIGTVSVT